MKMVSATKRSNRNDKNRFSQVKDKAFKTLAKLVEIKGFKVRREELKAGPGWRASSGACRARTDKLIFVERRLPQDDQLNFLIATAIELGLVFTAEELSELPQATQEVLSSSHEIAA